MPPRKRATAQPTEAEKKARRLAELRKKFLELSQQADEIDELIAGIKTEAAELVNPEKDPAETVTEPVGDGQISVQPNRRFDEETARAYLSKMNKDVLPLITVEKLDSGKAKNLLAPAAYRKCMKSAGKPKVIIK